MQTRLRPLKRHSNLNLNIQRFSLIFGRKNYDKSFPGLLAELKSSFSLRNFVILLLVPFTKISHVALFAGTQLVSELGWHLAPGGGRRVALALGKENEPI